MSKKVRRLLCLAMVAAAFVKYMQLDESKKRYIKDLLKQVP